MEIKNRRQHSLIIQILLILFCLPVNSFSAETLCADTKSTVPEAGEIANDFLAAVNSGERNIMQDFILQHFDENALKRIPLFAVVNLNMGFYYESGGLGYELLNTPSSEGNLIAAELSNRLTGAKLKLTIPTSGAPSYKINMLIKMELLPPTPEIERIKPMPEEEMVERIEKCLKKLGEDEEFSGTVLLARDGKILLEEAIGMASKAYEVPNRMDTKFNLASVGKMFTGVAVTQLAEQGKLSFDDPVGKYVSADWLSPDVSQKIKIKHLLTHTSGLGDYFRDAYGQCEIPFFRELDDYQSLVADDTLLFEPGTRFLYSNTGMLLLGVVIENVSGEGYFTYLKKHIFEPAGMLDTDGFAKDRPVHNRATGYTKLFENGAIHWNNHQYTRIMRGSPSGGIYSTAPDLLKFEMALKSHKLLSEEFTEILLKGRPELNASFHGYGFFIAEGVAGREISHGGDGQGMNCRVKMYLDAGYTYAVLSNYSRPSAEIVANVLDQLISYGAGAR
jgi:CubicO group peptidase (beta-lactamase class C family)